jgi:hypothetical protein
MPTAQLLFVARKCACALISLPLLQLDMVHWHYFQNAKSFNVDEHPSRYGLVSWDPYLCWPLGVIIGHHT